MKPRAFGEISLVGGESLLGREFSQLAAEQKLPAKIRLIGVDQGTITLSQREGAPVVITPLDEGALAASAIAVLAGSRASSAKALGILALLDARPALIDMTYAAEDDPRARLRAPLIETPDTAVSRDALHVIAHPASVSLAQVLLLLAPALPVRSVQAHIFEPASERGRAGLEEMREQTVSLLSFKSMPKAVFDAQASFNLLARYGDDAPYPLAAVETRIEKHLASLIGGRLGVPLPSIRLIHAPVFHGYSISMRVEFARQVEAEAVLAALQDPGIDLRGGDLEPPNNVGIAGQDGIAVGAVTVDRNDPRACWLWVVADNFRLFAQNALSVARSLLPAAVEEA